MILINYLFVLVSILSLILVSILIAKPALSKIEVDVEDY